MKRTALIPLGLGVLLMAGCLKENTSADMSTSKVRVEKPIVLTSDDLRRQHAANESAAEQKFQNQLLEVTGPIGAIYRESPLIGIGFGVPQDPLPPVLCEMDRQQLDVLSQLQPGQTVTVRGTYMGKIQGGSIGLGKCRLVAGGR